jgi:hypothetical protein
MKLRITGRVAIGGLSVPVPFNLTLDVNDEVQARNLIAVGLAMPESDGERAGDAATMVNRSERRAL